MILKLVTAVAVGLAVVSPALLAAAEEGIVPSACRLGNAGPCTICHLGVLVINLTNFLMKTIAFPAAALLVAIGGLMLLISGASENLRTTGKTILTNTVIGLIIVMTAWLLTDTAIKVLAGESRDNFFGTFGPWHEVSPERCPIAGESLVSSFSVPPPAAATPLAASPAVTACRDCVRVSVPISQRACAPSAQGQCQINADTERRLEALLNSIVPERGNILIVTEAYPPTRTHQNPCHQAATCLDMNLVGNYDNARPADVAYVAGKASAGSIGLRLVYEVESQARADALVRGGVSPNGIQILPPRNGVRQITAEHFSVYNDNASVR